MAALASPDLDLNIARPTLDVVVEYNDAVQLKLVEMLQLRRPRGQNSFMYVPGKSSDAWSFRNGALARKTVEIAAPRPDTVALAQCASRDS